MKTLALGQQPYLTTWQAMKDFTDQRTADTEDEIWLVEHPAVFTLGQAGKSEHILQKTDIPIIKSDRGGQVTYHGPGQLIAYILMDIKRSQLGIRKLVELLEQSVIDLLANFDIQANGNRQAPGIYVKDQKISSIGLRVRRGCTFHGLSLNVDMDLNPFLMINPCGYKDLTMTQLKDLGITASMDTIKRNLLCHLLANLSYNGRLD